MVQKPNFFVQKWKSNQVEIKSAYVVVIKYILEMWEEYHVPKLFLITQIFKVQFTGKAQFRIDDKIYCS